MGSDNPEFQEGVIAEIKEETIEPPPYKVLLHNDDYTPREFVVGILMAFFGMSADAAARLMWFVHRHGIGECGTYPYEVAETKVHLVTEAARENGFPLKTSLEPQ
jgi:ATP-dependent Clp protease adaptor protein ClpS